ncbi:zf-HC2 domain-containing protein [Streptoalloteichus hindustanus]|uniref:Putative zinc-finger n=1 Tax=Streptoalloteichus hindustanus TaxID=2017 RepID=A0A1M5J2R2_STRHI|nr:zf-HC2 domain-containing protein [Streptoalloteichus hindustanus]SHG34897.1 Putative zinc-finger [Streptoalloteichus hindustanus]
MTHLRGWALPVQHLAPDAVVAFVDGELSPTAHDRAAAHLARCPRCAAEAATQRQARAAVRTAAAPHVPTGLLAALRDIPQNTELPPAPDNLAVSEDGQLVAVLRPLPGPKGPVLGDGPVLGSTTPLGVGSAVLGQQRRGRRGWQGAGLVVSGLVLGALALVNPTVSPVAGDSDEEPSTVAPANARAVFGADGSRTASPSRPAPPSSSSPVSTTPHAPTPRAAAPSDPRLRGDPAVLGQDGRPAPGAPLRAPLINPHFADR